MFKPPAPAKKRFVPLQRAKVVSSGPAAVVLKTGQLTLEIRVLAEDLFRLRVAKGRSFSPHPSWAVVPNHWETPAAEVQLGRGQIVLKTARGIFRLDIRTGQWDLQDQHGLSLFSAEALATGYAEQAPSVRLQLQEDEAIFGLGESTGTFNKRGLIRDFWNIDVGGHSKAIHAALRNMYISIPFALSLRHGRAAGLFWDNPGRQSWDIGQTVSDQWQMHAASGEIDLYFFLGPTCAQVVERYTELTGRMPLPPLWGLGYQQCRYSYETRQRVEEIGRTFRKRKIPCDVLYLDIDYMDGYRVFTFGKSFPKPASMIERLGEQGFKVVTIVDPGVKDDPDFPVLQRGLAEGAFVKKPDGKEDYLGEVWPGAVRFPDFLKARTRKWWALEQVRFQAWGISGFWNDMNEPADFSASKKDFPGDCLHETESGVLRHSDVHNVYGSQMAKASYEGSLAAKPDRRPFIITRAGYAGLQRHAAVWTGDNDSTWEHLADSVQMLLNLSVSGVAFCGADVGGFHHNTTGELLARWTQLAAFTPFFRNHSNAGTIHQEPWAFGLKIEEICRRYIELRYQLLPYLYSLFVRAHRDGAPVMRPLFWHYQNDPAAVAASDQFLLGPDLLVAPILRQGATARSVYLPVGLWYDFWRGEEIRGGKHVLAEAGLDLLPIYVKAGGIVPIVPVQQYIGESKDSVVNLHVWPGTNGELHWYEDDGLSLAYEHGLFHERHITIGQKRGVSVLRFSAAQGSSSSEVKKWRILLRCVERPARVKMRDRRVPAGFDHSFAICAFEIENREEAFEVAWT